MQKIAYPLSAILFVLILQACSPACCDRPGHEFMPDMAHSIAYEANYYSYYSLNTWGSEEEYRKYAMPRLPVKGTIARGSSGQHYAASAEDKMNQSKSMSGQLSPNSIAIASNSQVPYEYGNTEEERTRASNEIIDNPFPITDAGLEKGKKLYDIYCGICHGEKGDGNGYIVREADAAKGISAGVYPAQPANLINDEFTAASNGRMYHAIVHGKNVMGAYTNKLSYDERWQVIHYIRSLQAKERKLVYNQDANTLNDIEKPANLISIEVEETKEINLETNEGDESHSQDSHH